MIKNKLINLLDRLIGISPVQLYSIGYLFGATNQSHDARKARWEKALARLWRDKDMLDFLYYQAESDKEVAWRGKTDKRLSQGARLRTLFIVRSAHLAYEKSLGKRGGPDEKDDALSELQKVGKIYKDLTNIDV